MHRRPLTRRQTLQAGAAAFAAGLLPSVPAVAAPPAALFELSLAGELDAAAASAAGWRTTRVLRAPRRFDLVGLRWSSADAVEAQVRARRRNGGWSRWTALHPSGAHAPDGERVRGTEPVYTGTADQLQLRLRGSARGLRARFVRAQPAARVANALSGRASVAQSAQAPAIVPRAAWGAGAVPPRERPAYGQVQLAFVHHTATSNDYSPQESAGIVLGIARYHRDGNGWNDIGYNFLVDRYGQIFEGRAGGIDQAVVGAQAQGYNSVSTGIACIGDFSAIAQSPAALDALARLIGWKLGIHGVPVHGQVTVTSAGGSTNRHKTGAAVTFERVSGHRDANNTACPGHHLYEQLPGLRERAAAHARPAAGISLHARSRRLRHPGTARLSGDVRLADGRSPAGVAVALQFRPGPDAGWTALGAVRAGADGAFSADVAVPESGAVRAVSERAPGGSLASPAVALTVVPRFSLSVHTPRLRAGRVLRVRGKVDPAPDGRIALTLERRSGRAWVPVRRRSLRAEDGTFYVRLRLRERGLYRITASTSGVTRRRQVRATIT